MSLPKKIYAENISASDTIDLRSRILRPGQPIEVCHYPGDEVNSTFHLGVRTAAGQVVSNGTFVQQSHNYFPLAKLPYRLRGMATDTLYQSQGLGTIVIHAAINILMEKQCDLIWFNARTSAEKFYSKLGFDVTSDIFDIPLAGPHKVMYKWL